MKPVILDTSFIITCIKQKIDFREELNAIGLKPVFPKQVIDELKGLSKSNSNAQLALQIFSKYKFEIIDLGIKNVDNSIIQYAKHNEDVFIATLDREIIKKISNSRIIIRQKKKLEIN